MSNSNKIKGISRRDFLKGTAAGALGVAAAGLLGGCTRLQARERKKNRLPVCWFFLWMRGVREKKI